MRDVVVVGGGLSGLAAAYQLQTLNIPYTLIEVKPRLGGSIQTVQQDGFVMDTGPFVLDDTPLPSELIPEDMLYCLENGAVAFRQGTQTLVDILSKPLTGPRMMRMAVSSIGQFNGRYSICMENGLVFDARALILAVPARFAERIFYGYITEITEQLMDYHYDTLVRVTLGYRREDVPERPQMPPDAAYAFDHYTNHPERVPEGHILMQLGIRIDPKRCHTDDITRTVIEHIGLPADPVIQRADYWSEADPLSCYDDDHMETMEAVQKLLPAGIALIGSDYSTVPPAYKGINRLDDRVRQGFEAAEHIARYLKG